MIRCIYAYRVSYHVLLLSLRIYQHKKPQSGFLCWLWSTSWLNCNSARINISISIIQSGTTGKQVNNSPEYNNEYES